MHIRTKYHIWLKFYTNKLYFCHYEHSEDTSDYTFKIPECKIFYSQSGTSPVIGWASEKINDHKILYYT